MGFDLKRFMEVAKPASEKELEEAKFRDENRDWLLKSSLIALEVRRYLRLNGMNQNQLAERMGISPAMVTKLLSGKENLGLKTICAIEKVIKVDLLRIPCDVHLLVIPAHSSHRMQPLDLKLNKLVEDN